MPNQAIQKMTPDDGQSMDIKADNIAKVKALFPEILSEGRIDFAVLKQILGEEVEEAEERYSFTWNGKARARRLAQIPSTGTLRPCKEESKNWDTTQNLFIEGDNLEVLKLLQKSYHQKVKMIYIDPPYNTGKDFIYPDDFRDNIKNYLELTGQSDQSGKRLSANPETSGRYHTDWLNMMYPRLKLARNLLKNDGSIFISIDDTEVSNLRKICDEIFGEENFLANIVWEKVHTRKNSSKFFSVSHDHILAYAKQKNNWDRQLLPREDTNAYSNPGNDVKGPWKADPVTAHNYYSADYKITKPNGVILSRPEGRYWAFSEESIQEKISNNEIIWGPDNSYPMIKRYLCEVQDGLVPVTIFTRKFAGDTATAKRQVDELLGIDAAFDYPKPSQLIKRLIQISARPNDIVMDFFSGSGSAAQAIFEQNFEHGSDIKFIAVQLPEAINDHTTAGKAGYKTIADLCRKRIISAGSIIKNKAEKFIDVGFRSFKLDSSNIKPWDADFDSLSDDLLSANDVIKSERSADDVLFEILLKYGLDLSLPITTHTLAGKSVFEVGAGALLVCLEQGITEAVAEAIGQLKTTLAPTVCRVVFKDAGFADDAAKVNAVQVLKQFGIDDVKSL